MTALCAGRDPEWWSPGSDGARLAMAICRRCTGCPSNDPTPHGVIRQGVPYGDTGRVLPVCDCGYPNAGYRGGPVLPCARCAVPTVPIPDRKAVRASRIRHLAVLGLTARAIGIELRVSKETVRTTCTTSGRERAPRRQPERSTA